MTFSLEKTILWIEDLYFSGKQRFEDQNVLMDFASFNVNSLTGDPLTGEDPLVNKRCNAPNLFL